MNSAKTFWIRNKTQNILLLCVLVTAIFLRFYQLDHIPAGLYYDEAADMLDAVITFETGEWPAFYDSQGGKEALWFWILALVFYAFEVEMLTLRVTAAVIGVFTVVAVWWAAHEIFTEDDKTTAFVLVLLSAAVLATLFVHVTFSRNGYRLLTQPLVGTLAMASLWRALRGKNKVWFVISGVLLGAAMYTYSAARFYLLFLVVFFSLQCAFAQFRAGCLLRQYFKYLIITTVIAFVVFLPMGLYLFDQLDLVLHRADEVSVFNPTWNKGNLWYAFFDSTWRNFAGLVWQGTADSHWNLPGRPMLDFFTIPLFLVGVVVAVLRVKRAGYLFILLWLIILYLPAILSYDRVPIFHRAMGAAPAVAMLVAVGAWSVWVWLASKIKIPPLSFWRPAVPVISILLISGTLTAYDYFAKWATSWDTYTATQPFYLDLVNQMNQDTEPDVVYVFPYDLRAGRFRHPDLDLFYRGSAEYSFLSDHEGSIFKDLTETVSRHKIVRVVDWHIGRATEADPKKLTQTLLTMYGQPLGVTVESPAYQIHSFKLTQPQVNFETRPALQSLNQPLDNTLTLSAYAFGPTGNAQLIQGNPVPVNGNAWVLLVWRATNSMPVDYKVSVRLTDGQHVVSQNDKLLFNGFHLGTSAWGPSEENFDLYLLPLEQIGQYQLQVIVYNPQTGEELIPGGITIPEGINVQ